MLFNFFLIYMNILSTSFCFLLYHPGSGQIKENKDGLNVHTEIHEQNYSTFKRINRTFTDVPMIMCIKYLFS